MAKHITTLSGKVCCTKKIKEGTLKVKVQRSNFNKKYKKTIQKFSTFHVHLDPELREFVQMNDSVLIVNCRPYSKTKTYKVLSRESK